ncbi:MAG: tyrosine-type recombinase/integrase [Actinomycetospora chiangmaiensis]|nr:tyrosine-type recombinase/integrase [Actinomycetospora chiangmaiensis]
MKLAVETSGEAPTNLRGSPVSGELGEAVGSGLVDPTLLERAGNYARGARASSTWEAYDRDMARFAAWCTARGLTALPAEPATVCVWLADQAPVWRSATAADPLEVVVEGQVLERDGLRPATIARRLAAVSVVHRAAGVANPAAHEQVRATMAGIRRHPGVAPAHRRTAARTEQVHSMTSGLDPEHDAVDARDLALILIGYAAALRRSDLARLDLADLSVDEHGLSVRVRRSKTDQEAEGAVVGIAADDDGACPAAEAWELWRAHLARTGVTRGAAWRPIHRSRQDVLTIRAARLSGRSINEIIVRRAAQVGLDGNFGSHSLRRGLATEAIANGVPEHAVMRHGRWRSATTMRGYVDDAERFAATNPTRHLGLRREPKETRSNRPTPS